MKIKSKQNSFIKGVIIKKFNKDVNDFKVFVNLCH